jgi:PAS domain S-box-containing protein
MPNKRNHGERRTVRVSPGFGQRVYDLTIAKRRPDGAAWGTADLSDALGVTPAAARSYFGGTVPRGKTLARLAAALGVTMDELLNGDGDGSDSMKLMDPDIARATPLTRFDPVPNADTPENATARASGLTAQTPKEVMDSYQRWVAQYFVSGKPISAVIATQWMARLWEAASDQTEETRRLSFAPGHDEAAVLVGPEGQVLAVSESLCHMLELREQDAVGRSGCEYAATEEDADLLRGAMLSEQKTPVDLLMRASSGNTVPVTAYPSKDDGDTLQVTFVRREEQSNRPTAESPGIMVTTLDGRIALVNDRFASLFGMSREQFQGRYSWEMVTPAMRKYVRERVLSGVTGRSEWTVVEADGKPIRMSAETTIETLNGVPMRVTRGWPVAAEQDVDALSRGGWYR